MKRLPIIVLALFTSGIFCASAWNAHGHSVIAYVAEQNLTPKARKMCHHYLRHTLPYYASWMDHWRYCPGYEESRGWHGVRVNKNNEMHNPNRTNAITQIDAFRRETKQYRRMSDSTVMENIKYLIHMVADVHSPVHMVYYNMPEFKQDTLSLDGRKMRYHDLLDGSPTRMHKKWTIEQYNAHLESEWGHEKRAVSRGTAEEWMVELAIDSKRLWKMMPNGSEWNNLSSENRKGVEHMIERRLYIAGIRLATVLNEIFEK